MSHTTSKRKPVITLAGIALLMAASTTASQAEDVPLTLDKGPNGSVSAGIGVRSGDRGPSLTGAGISSQTKNGGAGVRVGTDGSISFSGNRGGLSGSVSSSASGISIRAGVQYQF